MSVDSQTHENSQHNANEIQKTMVVSEQAVNGSATEHVNVNKHTNRKKIDVHGSSLTPQRPRKSPTYKTSRNYYSPSSSTTTNHTSTDFTNSPTHNSHYHRRQQQQPFEENYTYRQHYMPPSPSTTIQSPNKRGGTRFSLVCYGRGRKQVVQNSFDSDDSNIYRFFKSTTPQLQCEFVEEPNSNGTDQDHVETNNTTCVCENDLKACHCANDKRVRYPLKQLWQFYDEPYGIEVPILIRGNVHNVYLVPHLSALQLYKSHQVEYQYFETASPDLRCPLIDKIEELSQSYSPLLNGYSNDFDKKSWFSIAWYPILCHNETMNWLKGQIITYHHFEPCNKLIDHAYYFGAVERSQSVDEALANCSNNNNKIEAPNGYFYTPVVGFLPYKVRNETWFVNSFDSNELEEDDLEFSNHVGKMMQGPLYLVRACRNMLYEMQIHHPDFFHVIQNFRELAQV